MLSCHDMKVGEIYVCPKCGLELEVKKSCDCIDGADCTPIDDEHCCDFTCCGVEMQKK